MTGIRNGKNRAARRRREKGTSCTRRTADAAAVCDGRSAVRRVCPGKTDGGERRDIGGRRDGPAGECGHGIPRHMTVRGSVQRMALRAALRAYDGAAARPSGMVMEGDHERHREIRSGKKERHSPCLFRYVVMCRHSAGLPLRFITQSDPPSFRGAVVGNRWHTAS